MKGKIAARSDLPPQRTCHSGRIMRHALQCCWQCTQLILSLTCEQVQSMLLSAYRRRRCDTPIVCILCDTSRHANHPAQIILQQQVMYVYKQLLESRPNSRCATGVACIWLHLAAFGR